MTRLVGILPAAGASSRLFPYNGAKELLPVGSQSVSIDGRSEDRPRIVSQYVIEAMAEAGVDQIFIVTVPTKQGLMGLHLDGGHYGVHIAYIVQHPPSMAHSIDLVYPWVKDATVVMGMPDTIIRPTTAIAELMERHRQGLGELSLGLFPTDKPHKFGMIKVDPEGNVVHHEDKPDKTDATLMWGLAVWESSFTETLHQHIGNAIPTEKELALGSVFDVYMRQGGACKGYIVSDGSYYDIGTYDDYRRAVEEL